jgi:hypothetical protein
VDSRNSTIPFRMTGSSDDVVLESDGPVEGVGPVAGARWCKRTHSLTRSRTLAHLPVAMGRGWFIGIARFFVHARHTCLTKASRLEP